MKNIPVWKVVNPQYWIPQVITNVQEQEIQYHFFEMVMSDYELQKINKSNPGTYFNLDELEEDNILDDN